MKITVFSVNVSTKTSVNGKAYQNAEVAFKNLETGKVESKNLTQYSTVFPKVVEAKEGGVYEVTPVKDSKGFWQWEGFSPTTADVTPKAPASTSNPVPKSNFETPEERQQRQLFIIRQSSIANSIQLLSTGAKHPPEVSLVLKVAQDFVDFVYGNKFKPDDLFEAPNDDFNTVD